MKAGAVIIFLLILLFPGKNVRQLNNSALYIDLEQTARGFTSPVGLSNAGDGSHRLFIYEQPGKIKIVKNGTVMSKPFLDVSRKIGALNIGYSEKGLLGLAFHPGYESNGRFFIYYSAPYAQGNNDHTSILAEYKVSKTNADSADPSSERIILAVAQPESNHNGGCIEFGPDGYLYIGLGDGGGAGDRHGSIGNGQDLNTLLGKILRIDVNGKHPYEIPSDNPFISKGGKPEIWAFGLRNPWKFSFDRVTGKLFCADVGQNMYEEVNIIEKGKNYGWRIMEGFHCFDPPEGCDKIGLELPVDEYDHSTGISVIGGYMYRGMSFPSWHGYYFFGDWNGPLFALKQKDKSEWHRYNVLLRGNTKNDIGRKINGFGMDERGDIYVVTQTLFGPKSPTGIVYRLVP
jgi:glucose/arabinose dehydrogenase